MGLEVLDLLAEKRVKLDSNDPHLRSFATARQLEYLDAMAKHGSQRKAAAAAGVARTALQASLKRLLHRAAVQGYSPEHGMTNIVPAPFVVKGVSTLYDEAGRQKQQWVKTTRDEAMAEQVIRDFVEHLAEDVRGKSPTVPAPRFSDEDLLVVYPMGDPHFGMYAWADEAGEDFDIELADKITRAAIDRLVDSAPGAHTAVLAELGDFFHADNNSARTPQSGNALDVDSRWYKVMQVGVRAMRYAVERLLEKHAKVIVRIVQGNHDTHSAIALALVLSAYFENNKRVVIDLSPSAFWYYEFGQVLLGVTHGDTCKPGQLQGEMAAGKPDAWGRTKFRHWLRGHVHHTSVQEYQGCLVESFRTLAPRDAWHASQGYRSGRDMYCIIYHREFGEIERHRCDVLRVMQ